METRVLRLAIHLTCDGNEQLGERAAFESHADFGLSAVINAFHGQHARHDGRIENPRAGVALRGIREGQLQGRRQNLARGIRLRGHVHDERRGFDHHQRHFHIAESLQLRAQENESGVHIHAAAHLTGLRDHVDSLDFQAGFHRRAVDARGQIVDVGVGQPLVEDDDRGRVRAAFAGVQLIR